MKQLQYKDKNGNWVNILNSTGSNVGEGGIPKLISVDPNFTIGGILEVDLSTIQESAPLFESVHDDVYVRLIKVDPNAADQGPFTYYIKGPKTIHYPSEFTTYRDKPSDSWGFNWTIHTSTKEYTKLTVIKGYTLSLEELDELDIEPTEVWKDTNSKGETYVSTNLDECVNPDIFQPLINKIEESINNPNFIYEFDFSDYPELINYLEKKYNSSQDIIIYSGDNKITFTQVNNSRHNKAYKASQTEVIENEGTGEGKLGGVNDFDVYIIINPYSFYNYKCKVLAVLQNSPLIIDLSSEDFNNLPELDRRKLYSLASDIYNVFTKAYNLTGQTVQYQPVYLLDYQGNHLDTITQISVCAAQGRDFIIINNNEPYEYKIKLTYQYSGQAQISLDNDDNGLYHVWSFSVGGVFLYLYHFEQQWVYNEKEEKDSGFYITTKRMN